MNWLLMARIDMLPETYTETYMPETLLTLKEAAARLNVSLTTIRRMIYDGELKGIKVRGDWRIDPVDLEEYIRRNKSKPKDN